MFIVAAVAWSYVRFGRSPQFEALLYGVKPVVIASVVQALWRLGRTALKTRLLIAVGIVAMMLSGVGVHELAILFGAGFFMLATRWSQERQGGAAVGYAASVFLSNP